MIAWSASSYAAPPSRGKSADPALCADALGSSASIEQLLSQGRCLEAQGRLLQALELYQRALRRMPSRAIAAHVQARIDTVSPQLAAVRVELATDVSGARVRVDGEASDPGTERKVNPGVVSIEVDAPGRTPFAQRIELAPGERRALTVLLSPRAPAEPEPAPSLPSPRQPDPPVASAGSNGSSPLKPVGFVLAGVGLAALAAGGATGYLALTRAAIVRRECPTPTTCSAEGASAAHSGAMLGSASTIALATGAGLSLAGVAFIVLAPSRATVEVRPTVGGVALTATGW